MRVAIREFLDKIGHGSNQDAEKAFHTVTKLIDKTAQKGTIHKNQASRRKSRLSKRLKAKTGTAAKK